MSSKHIYAISGLFVGAVVDLLINLLAAGIQNRFILDQFSNATMWGLAGLAILGLLVGHWLGSPLKIAVPLSSQGIQSERPEMVTVTRLRALLSYSKLKGKGIRLSDVLLIGSRIDIET